jgi:DNA-binding MarR family transcriptional regulator
MHSYPRSRSQQGTRRKAEKWAYAQNLPQTEKAVLAALARRYSGRWGRCEVTQKQIADEIGVTRETVNRKLASLEKKQTISAGTLPRKDGQWDRNFYILNSFQRGLN